MRDCYIHHSGGIASDNYASTAHITVEQINDAHRRRWGDKSSMNSYIGYNVVYDPKTRKFTQTRALGSQTIAQRGYNREFSLCIIGNYSRSRVGTPHGSVDELTQQTRDDVAEFLFKLIAGSSNLVISYSEYEGSPKLNFSIARIYPHRRVSSTQCFGSFLYDDIFKNDLINLSTKKIKMWKKLLELYIVWKSLLNKRKALLGSVDERECEGNLTLL